MKISTVNNTRNNISKTSEDRYAEDAAMALAGMGSVFSQVLNNIQTEKETNLSKSADTSDRNISKDTNMAEKEQPKEVDNKSKSADNNPKKTEETAENSKGVKAKDSSEKKSESKETSKTDSKETSKTDSKDISKTEAQKNEKSDSLQVKSSTNLSVKSDSLTTTQQAVDKSIMQDQMDFVKKFENTNIKVSVKNEASTLINDMQNMLMANSNAANIDSMSDNVLKSAGIKDMFDGKSFEQIKEIMNNSGSGFSDMQGFNFEFNGQKVLEKANSLKLDKVIRTQIKEFASKLTSLVKNVPNSTNATAKMVLRPESLGTVFVDINSTDGVVKLKIKAQSREVIDKLEAQIAELRQKLEKSGLIADNIEFALYEDGENAFNSFGYSKEKQDEMEARKEFVRSFTQLPADETQEELKISNSNGIIEQYI